MHKQHNIHNWGREGEVVIEPLNGNYIRTQLVFEDCYGHSINKVLYSPCHIRDTPFPLLFREHASIVEEEEIGMRQTVVVTERVSSSTLLTT